MQQTQKGRGRGFASMSPEKKREIASKGGKAAHALGTAHKWTSEEAQAAPNITSRRNMTHSQHGSGTAEHNGSPASCYYCSMLITVRSCKLPGPPSSYSPPP
jgi:general stress protein YciG